MPANTKADFNRETFNPRKLHIHNKAKRIVQQIKFQTNLLFKFTLVQRVLIKSNREFYMLRVLQVNSYHRKVLSNADPVTNSKWEINEWAGATSKNISRAIDNCDRIIHWVCTTMELLVSSTYWGFPGAKRSGLNMSGSS